MKSLPLCNPSAVRSREAFFTLEIVGFLSPPIGPVTEERGFEMEAFKNSFVQPPAE
jgi:hypothetical protein